MKKSIFALTTIAALIGACQTKTPEQQADSLATASDTSMVNSKACYAYVKNKDTVSLTTTTVGNAITGELNYSFFEKDKNTGTIAGQIKGDTIIADYTFNSEGKSSVRQVAFLKKDNQLIEGYGPSQEKDGKMVFNKTADLKFGNAVILTERDCK